MSIEIKRLLSAVIDSYIVCFLSTFVVFVITLGKMQVTPLTVSVFLFSNFSFFAMKDYAFKSASVGKRLFKIHVHKTNNTGFSFVDAIKRTLPVCLLPVEAILLLIKNKRIGDIWAKTTVISR